MYFSVIFVSTLVALSLGQPAADDPCRDCRIENGVGYKEHQSRCDQFYICYPLVGRSGYNATLLDCPCGLFWSQKVLACVHAGDFDCPSDPCKNNVPSYADPDSCKAYFVCEGQKTTSELCCPAGERYNNGACVPDPNDQCTDDCPCAPSTTPSTVPCQFSAISGEPGKYLWTYGNGASSEMLCPPGVNFNSTSCWCDIRVDTPIVRRCLDFSVLYSEIPLIDHAKNAWIENKGVSVQIGPKTGTYANNAYLSVPRFSNIEWSDVIGLDVEFNGQNHANSDGPLIDNCDCNEPSTISLRLTQFGGNNVVELKLKTINDPMITLRANYNTNQLNRAKVAYDGSTVLLSVSVGNTVVDSDTAAASGRVATCQCGLKIGYAWQNRFYNGLMSRTDIYIGCLPPNFI